MIAVRRLAYLVTVSAAALMAVEACSDAVGDAMFDMGTKLADAGAGMRAKDGGPLDVGQMLEDAGQAIADAGGSLRDGRSDAVAQNSAGYKSGSRIEMRISVQTGAD